jgi:hypothetical protein
MSRRQRKGQLGQLLRLVADSCDPRPHEAAHAALSYTVHAERGASDRTQFVYFSEALAGILGAITGRISAVSETADTDMTNQHVAILAQMPVGDMRRVARLLALGAGEFERVAKALKTNPSGVD